MDPAELRTRRIGLGLSQSELAEILGTTQIVVSRWETGRRAPRDPDGIRRVLDEYEARLLDITDGLVGAAEDGRAAMAPPGAVYRVYADADAYQRHCPYARAVPLGVHTMAVARAAALVRSAGRAPRIIAHEPPPAP